MTTLKNLADWHNACRHKHNKTINTETINGPGGTVTINHFEAERLCREVDHRLSRMRSLLHRVVHDKDEATALAKEILEVLNED